MAYLCHSFDVKLVHGCVNTHKFNAEVVIIFYLDEIKCNSNSNTDVYLSLHDTYSNDILKMPRIKWYIL